MLDIEPRTPSLFARMRLAGRYEIAGLLGVGGMGSVYRARDLELDELVAVKVLRRELVSQPEILERFRREVKLARRVTHTNVARVFDIGEHGGEKFITMELVEGESLGARLTREGALPIADAVAIAAAMGEGLVAAHAAGVVHRDLKPDNVLLARGGRVVVSDFGIARAVAVAGPSNRTAGLVMGTPEYMAPEQVEAGPVDARTDVYAWGIVLYEMLTGRAAWSGDSVLAIVTARMLAPPPDPRAFRPEVPLALAELVVKMLARAPAGRPASARDVLTALEALSPPLGTAHTRRAPAPLPNAPAARQVQRIAVVPLACDDESLRVAAFGIADLVADALDGRAGIDVRARGARLIPLADRELTAVGRDLDVPLVVGGRLEAGAARLALVNARDGFVLWSRAFPAGARDPFGTAYDAAREIGEALLVPAGWPPAAPPADAKTAELLLRARFEASRGDPEGDDRVVALLEQAFSRAPGDPWVNAAYALALARRLSDTEFPGDADEAFAMARAAVERAPRLAATHHALAEVLLDRGELVEAARAAATAMALAPGSAEVMGVVAHLLTEAGAVDEALSLLRSASARDAPGWRATCDLARGLTVQGLWQEADERLDAAEGVDHLAAGPWLARVRCALFRRDLVRCDALRMQLGEVVARDKDPILSALDAVLGRAPAGVALDRIEEAARSATCSRQGADALRKLAVDVAGVAGESTRAAALLGMLDRRGLVDVTWLDRSPTLANVRTRAAGAFALARDAAATRARAMRDALQEPHETLQGAPR